MKWARILIIVLILSIFYTVLVSTSPYDDQVFYYRFDSQDTMGRDDRFPNIALGTPFNLGGVFGNTTAGKIGDGAIHFNGSTDSNFTNFSMDFQEAIRSFDLWIKPQNVTSTATIFEFSNNPSSDNNIFSLELLVNHSVRVTSVSGGVPVEAFQSSALTVDNWYHIIISLQDVPNTWSLYVNGNINATIAGNPEFAPSDYSFFSLGRGARGDSPQHYNGSIDNFVASRYTYINTTYVADSYNNGNGLDFFLTNPFNSQEMYYRFESQDKAGLDEGTSNRVWNLSGTFHNITSPKIGEGAIRFNGSDLTNNFTYWNMSSAVSNISSFDFWINPEDLASSDTFFTFSSSSENNNNIITVEIVAGIVQMQSYVGGVLQGTLSATNALASANTWYHIVITNNDTIGTKNSFLYIDGVENATLAGTDFSMPSDYTIFTLGRNAPVGDEQSYTGSIDNLAFVLNKYNSTHVTNSFNNGNGLNFLDVNQQPNVTINSPDDLTFKTTLLEVNFTPTDPDLDLMNVTLYINGTINATNSSLINGTFYYLSAFGMGNGHHSFLLEVCDNLTTTPLCRNSSARTYIMDDTAPTITFINPPSSGNLSIYNLTFNIAGNSSTLNWTNVTIYNGSVLYKSFVNFTNSSGNRLIFEVNFTSDGNYSINVSARSKTGVQTNSSSWFYYDRAAPNMTIASPQSNDIKTTQTPTFTFSFLDKSDITCYYRIVRNSTGVTEVSPTLFTCNSSGDIDVTSAQLTDNLNYTMHIHTNDTYNVNNSVVNFRVETVITPAPSGGGGGGGGSTTIISAEENIEFEILSDRRSSFYDFVIIDGDSRTRTIIINNKKNEIKDIEISCEGEICEWLTLDQTSISVAEASEQEISFVLEIPKNTVHKEYFGKIKATYKNFDPVFLDIRADVSSLGIILKEIKIQPSEQFKPIFIAAWLFGILTFIFSLGISALMFFAILKQNPTIALIISLIISAVISVSLVILL